jgi:hypothetical protein
MILEFIGKNKNVYKMDNYKNGWEDGKKLAESFDRPIRTEDFPKEFKHRNGEYNSGFAEGVIWGESHKPIKKRILKPLQPTANSKLLYHG